MKFSISGIRYLDTAIVLSISGLRPGDKFIYPGSDIFAKAINNLWKQRLFSGIQIYFTKIQDNRVSVEISVTERPRLGEFKFLGPKKSEADELKGKIGLVKGTIITENMKRNIVEVTQKYYRDKGFQNVTVTYEEKPDPNPAYVNSNFLTIYVNKGRKVRINDISFFGNESINDFKLKKQLKGTKETSRFTLFPPADTSRFGVEEKESFKEYVNDWGFLSLSKTRDFIDPYFRFKLFSTAKFDAKKFEEDKDKVIAYYNQRDIAMRRL